MRRSVKAFKTCSIALQPAFGCGIEPINPVKACARRSSAAGRRQVAAQASRKEIWVQTVDKATAITALEGGVSTLVFAGGEQGTALADAWASLGRFTALQADQSEHGLTGPDGAQAAVFKRVGSAAELRRLELELLAAPVSSTSPARTAAELEGLMRNDVHYNDVPGGVIPAESLIALSMSTSVSGTTAGPRLFAAVNSAAEARAMLEALEGGTAGVLLRCEDPSQVRELAAYVAERATQTALRHTYARATVTRVTPLGSGHRVCVDTVCTLKPGEGMLVGSFACGLFLVGCECEESGYVGSRPFRVNAGPVHSYVLLPNSRTGYLGELCSGSEVVVADVEGRSRSVLVGRAKVESRPLVLVEARVSGDGEGAGSSVSIMLQNAETVTLLGPQSQDMASTSWRSISVAQLTIGDQVYVLMQPPARHVGTVIDEHIVEK
ncbi:MAG: hypothetical protein WDW36_005057 [Sanguina aurantia]